MYYHVYCFSEIECRVIEEPRQHQTTRSILADDNFDDLNETINDLKKIIAEQNEMLHQQSVIVEENKNGSKVGSSSASSS